MEERLLSEKHKLKSITFENNKFSVSLFINNLLVWKIRPWMQSKGWETLSLWWCSSYSKRPFSEKNNANVSLSFSQNDKQVLIKNHTVQWKCFEFIHLVGVRFQKNLEYQNILYNCYKWVKTFWKHSIVRSVFRTVFSVKTLFSDCFYVVFVS